jgi:alcohol dehydrogenase (cytochrome c)
VQTNDKCGIFTRVDQTWESGKSFMGGTFAAAPEPAQRVLRAIDIQTGKTAWELPQFGTVESWGGVLATASDVVFFCDDSGAFAAADAKTGKRLWSFPDQPGVEVVADDLRVRQPAARGGGLGPEHPRLRAP